MARALAKMRKGSTGSRAVLSPVPGKENLSGMSLRLGEYAIGLLAPRAADEDEATIGRF
jgi:hypothetical protein